MVFGALSAALADVNPPGCTTNGMNQTLTRVPSVAHDGDTITYTVTVFNGAFPSCQATDVSVDFTAPAADGTATGAATNLDSGATFDPSDSITYPSILHVLALNPGVFQVSARSTFSGLLHDSLGDLSTVDDTKTVAIVIVEPNIEVTKTVTPTNSKVGDEVVYEICVTNTSTSAITIPGWVLENITVNDSLLGDLSGSFADTLAPGESECHTFPYVIQEGDPDPLVNTVTVEADDFVAGVDGFQSQSVSDTDEATVDLVQPSVEITKVPTPTTSKVGDTVNYEICVNNTGTVGLENITVTDTLLGDLSASFADTLAASASECQTFPYVVQEGDPDPLPNTATVHANPEGLANDITDSVTVEVDLVHPSFTIAKECSPDPVAVGGTLTWTITLENTGDVSLDIHVVDPTAGIDQTVTVAAAGTEQIIANLVVGGESSPITNSASATATLTGDILPNQLGPETADSSCAIESGGATRTPGYWFTHPDALLAAFDCITGSESGVITLCDGCEVDANDAMAIFYRTSGGNRPTLAQHILSAMFNQCVFGTPAPSGIIQDGLDVLCDANATPSEISAAIMPLDEFNNSGEEVPAPVTFGAADTAQAKSMAAAGSVPSCAAGKKVN